MLRVTAIAILIFVAYQIAAEAYSLNHNVVFVNEKILKLTWDAPEGGSDHYRIEIIKTGLSAQPFTSLSHAYTKNNRYEIALLKDYSYSFRIQSVSAYGALSDYSKETPLYIFDAEKAGITTGIEENARAPSAFSLSQNFPNPFNGTTMIRYRIPFSNTDGNSVGVRLTVFNQMGQAMRELVSAHQRPGLHTVIWDGRNDAGVSVASGLYIYQLTAGNLTISKKMVFLR